MNKEIYIFGSAVRGEVESNSDIDVLVLSNDACARQLHPASWSIYSPEVIAQYFKEGRLFAWHLYLESKCIFTNEPITFLASLGAPNSYMNLQDDFNSLVCLLNESLNELTLGSKNVVFELGVVYTAMRDIAMVASTKLLTQPTFSRYSPYLLPIEFPISRDLYESLIVARLASTRGTRLEFDITSALGELLKSPIASWLKNIEEKI